MGRELPEMSGLAFRLEKTVANPDWGHWVDRCNFIAKGNLHGAAVPTDVLPIEDILPAEHDVI